MLFWTLLVVLAILVVVAIVLWLMSPKKEAAAPPADQRAEAAIRAEFGKIKAAEGKAAELLARQEALAEELRQAEHEAKKWETVAAAAVESQNKDDVREAVKQRMEAEQKAAKIKSALDELAKTLAGLKEQLRLAGEKAQQTEADAAVLAARLQAAKIREDLAGDGGPGKALAELENEAIKAESRAEADEEISGADKGKAAIEQMDVDAEVERLMTQVKSKK